MPSKCARLPVVVGITAASGAALTERCITWLAAHGVPLYVTCSNNGRLVWQQELDESLEEAASRWTEHGDVTLVDVGDEAALIASGSLLTAGMIIVPCSTGSAAAIANGICTNVLHRAAEVTIKEGRPLVLVPRESPLSAIHLESWLKLARMGIKIVPPMLTFYNHPKDIQDMVDFSVGRALTLLGFPDALPEHLRYQR
ncbi:MAG: UbiX family flavin prenyltransferase [Chloroflexota bacterium]|nr:UbiX family flavin prenyltransferase [Chloroflexota bacterium]MDE2931684.1 UbiX family flavin prenyltransferase [Chloroflexota bacterium]